MTNAAIGDTATDTPDLLDPTGVSAVCEPGESGDPVEALEHEMLAVWRRVRGLMGERARAVHPKLDAVCYPMLVLLRRADAVAMADLLAELGIEKSTLTRRIDSAVRLGLVERRPDPADARARLVALTPSCRERLSVLADEESERWRGRLAQWDTTDIRGLTTLLRRLGDALD